MQGRKKGSLSGKYKHPIFNDDVGVYEYRNVLVYLRSLKQGNKIHHIKKGRPFGLSGKYKNALGKTIGVFEWRKINPIWKREQNKKNKFKRYKQQIEKEYKISLEQYKQIVSKCENCGFNLYPCDLHHIDHNKNNNVLSNFMGLCPTCHLGHHRGHISLKHLNINA